MSRASKLYIASYVSLAVVAAIVYWPAREFMKHQEPYGLMWVSNLTVNYILMFMLAGGATPWLTKKLFPRAPKWLQYVTLAIVIMILLMFVKALGYQTRF